MSDILSNRYFLSAVAILIAGITYYGYQATDNSTSLTDDTTTVETQAIEVTNSKPNTPEVDNEETGPTTSETTESVEKTQEGTAQ